MLHNKWIDRSLADDIVILVENINEQKARGSSAAVLRLRPPRDRRRGDDAVCLGKGKSGKLRCLFVTAPRPPRVRPTAPKNPTLSAISHPNQPDEIRHYKEIKCTRCRLQLYTFMKRFPASPNSEGVHITGVANDGCCKGRGAPRATAPAGSEYTCAFTHFLIFINIVRFVERVERDVRVPNERRQGGRGAAGGRRAADYLGRSSRSLDSRRSALRLN
ncbi:hypothetical protein EVAR_24155_1 [Eumeta japonica]|uniref:Uncharacterized protein n=1 Tax=Eumeta variegata TaxID=151549 RepID=A0A4C1W5Z2_EUMVA|nr:hypothetical protein EVAR_24155_1 [Eumeta japonica]